MLMAMENRITLYIAGDSTAAAKEERARPETGWGECLPAYLSPSVRVENRAANGRSSRSFLEEGRLEAILGTIRPGDYLLIQFGHNDSKEDPARRTEPVSEFPATLLRYAEGARAAGAVPVLLTPVVRRHFETAGRDRELSVLKDTHGPYLAAVKRLAAAEGLALLDLESRTRAVVESLGERESRRLYLHLAPGEFARYPNGLADDTHFSPAGADRVASLAAAEILRLSPFFPSLEPLARLVRA